MAVSHQDVSLQDVSLQDVSHQDVCGQAYSELAVGQWLPEGRGKVTDALRKGELTADVVVIGGGITGAGIAREAARRGLKTVLVERQDFAWGGAVGGIWLPAISKPRCIPCMSANV